MTTINQRLKEFLDYNHIQAPEFYRKIGVGRMEYSGWITAGRSISVPKLQSILNNYLQLNARWLLVGQGDMQEGYIPKVDGNMGEGTTENSVSTNCPYCEIRQVNLEQYIAYSKALEDHNFTLKERIADFKGIIDDKQFILEDKIRLLNAANLAIEKLQK
jgi:hypothetical protein